MSRPGPARADAVDGFDELEVANASFFIDTLGASAATCGACAS